MRRLYAGESPKQLVRELGVSELTLYTWKKKYPGMGVPELRKLKTQDDDIARSKRLVADLMLDITRYCRMFSQKSFKAR
jgi:putative transposase